jgi:hypothetical protein
MKHKASAAKKMVVVFRMASYIARPICAQLGPLVLALSICALPLAGVTHQQFSILTPLATELVPLGTSIQAAPVAAFQLPALLAASRIVLGILIAGFLATNLRGSKRFAIITIAGLVNFGAIESPTGRSPPLG